MNKQKSTEQTKKQQKTWIKIIKIVGIVLICLILFALIAFGVLRALGKSGIRKNISGEAPVLESTESTEEGWQDGCALRSAFGNVDSHGSRGRRGRI